MHTIHNARIALLANLLNSTGEKVTVNIVTTDHRPPSG
ncbi:MAG: hypothetical protein QOG73_4008 [Acetobacteraceae bacterium]|jgi:hypothetical protein|nr:hypothetical protein [Acetobacteraceae bacterium]